MKRTTDRLTQAEVAHLLGIGRDKVRRWTAAGMIPHLTDPENGQPYYSRIAVEAHRRRLGEIHAERAS